MSKFVTVKRERKRGGAEYVPAATTKGQLISKCLFGIFNSPQKTNEKFNIATMVTQVELFSFSFWENRKHQRNFSKLTEL